MTVLYHLPKKDHHSPSHWRLRGAVYAFIVVIVFIYSICATVLETKDSKNTSFPQLAPLEHSIPLPLGGSNRPDLKGWALTFHDEFNGTTLNTSVWNSEDYGKYRYQNCCLSFGSQYFTYNAISLRNGYLSIVSKKKNLGNANYTSGAITTENKFSFLYGRVDIRARFPSGQGMWPSLWMLTTHADREVDIMEMVNDPTIIYQTYHLNVPTYNIAAPQCIITRQNLSRALHVFSLIWNASSLTWYIDGKQTCHISNDLPKTPMYLLLDVAVGGDWPGSPDMSTTFPQSMVIDYVRVYQASSKSPCSGLQVTSPLRLANTILSSGDTLSATVTYTNRCTLPFAFLELLIAARTALGTNDDFGNKGAMTLQPGQSVTIDASRIIQSDLGGIGSAFSSFETPDGKWHSDGTDLVNFTMIN
jgi:beta-glucanase (GH16 family)